jgi:hypothetical protein
MGKFYVNTFLDFEKKVIGSKVNYNSSGFFSFFGYQYGSTKIEKHMIVFDTILRIGYTNTRRVNKKGYFIGFKRQGIIWTKSLMYITDVKYVDDLKSLYFKGRCREISREKVVDKTQGGVIKFKYNVEYEIM